VTSIQGLSLYLRYTHVLNYARLSGLFALVFGLDISDRGLANLFLHSTQTVVGEFCLRIPLPFAIFGYLPFLPYLERFAHYCKA
jgi:hypothetical protein